MIIGVNCSTKSCKAGPRGRTKAGVTQTTPTQVPLALQRPRAQEAEHTDGPGSTPSPGRRELLVARANPRSPHHNYGCCGQFYASAWPCYSTVPTSLLPRHQSKCCYEGIFKGWMNPEVRKLGRKADCPPHCGWASPNQLKVLRDKIGPRPPKEGIWPPGGSRELLPESPAFSPNTEPLNCHLTLQPAGHPEDCVSQFHKINTVRWTKPSATS